MSLPAALKSTLEATLGQISESNLVGGGDISSAAKVRLGDGLQVLVSGEPAHQPVSSLPNAVAWSYSARLKPCGYRRFWRKVSHLMAALAILLWNGSVVGNGQPKLLKH